MFCVLLRVCENVTTVYEIFKYGIERIAGVGGFYDLHCFLVIVLTTGLKLDGLSVVYRFVEHMRNILNTAFCSKSTMMKILLLAPFFFAVLVSSFRTETGKSLLTSLNVTCLANPLLFYPHTVSCVVLTLVSSLRQLIFLSLKNIDQT